MDYSDVISKLRRNQVTPTSIINEKGEANFGTFDKEFIDMDLTKAKKPTKLPNFMNRAKLSLWEAVEVNFNEGLLLTACCDMFVFGKILTLYYDKKTKLLYSFDKTIPSKSVTIADNLLNHHITKGVNKDALVEFDNNFNHGEAHVHGFARGKALKIPGESKLNLSKNYRKYYTNDVELEYDLKLERISLPAVGVMPFGKNRPLYSQKDFFKVTGYLKINGNVIKSDDFTTAIIDDHRGYYPRHAHYDWVTTLGHYHTGKQEQFFAFNLTRNQSINQEDYNENLIWLKGKTSILPPVKFTKSVTCNKFINYAEWTIKDEYGMVNLTYKIYNMFPMILHALVANIDYYVTFGELEGYVMGEDGTKYELNNVPTFGEEKTLLV